MSEAKVFRVKGYVKKPLADLHFSEDVRALKKEHALEKIYSEFGSRHKARRREVKITEVEEVKPTELAKAPEKGRGRRGK